jgi:hypothetical protein
MDFAIPDLGETQISVCDSFFYLAIYDSRFTIHDSRTKAEVAELADAHV